MRMGSWFLRTSNVLAAVGDFDGNGASDLLLRAGDNGLITSGGATPAPGPGGVTPPVTCGTRPGAAYTTSARTCGSTLPTAPACNPGDFEVGVTVDDGAWVCGPPSDRYPETKAVRSCRKAETYICQG